MSPMSDQFSTYQQVEPHRLLPRQVGATADLPQAGHPGPDPEPAVHVRRRSARPRGAAAGRGPTRDIEPPRTLNSCGSSSRRVAAQEAPPTRVTRGSLRHLEQHLVARRPAARPDRGGGPRRPRTIVRNFSSRNSRPSSPTRTCRNRTDPLLSRADADRDGRHHRAEHDEDDRGQQDVESALGKALALAVARRLHVDEREPGDRAGLDARADHVDDARREHEVLADRPRAATRCA